MISRALFMPSTPLRLQAWALWGSGQTVEFFFGGGPNFCRVKSYYPSSPRRGRLAASKFLVFHESSEDLQVVVVLCFFFSKCFLADLIKRLVVIEEQGRDPK